MKTNTQALSVVKKFAKRWFVQGMSAMAFGLFASLIIGVIISKLITPALAGIPALSEACAVLDGILSAQSPIVGAAVGVAIAYTLKAKSFVIFSSAVTGGFGYLMGGPVGAYVAALVGIEIGGLVAGKTPVDIILTPLITILAGFVAGWLAGPPVSAFMNWLGSVINASTELSPIPMGIAIAVLVGMTLSSPISSAGLCITLGLSGLAAGAAVVGCCCNMVGFAVISLRENGWGGFIAQAFGTSKIQLPNILRRPQIWIPSIAASAILGPVSSAVLGMTNTPYGAGMGSSALVGQFGTWDAMAGMVAPGVLFTEILFLHFILPAVLTLLFAFFLRKAGWIRPSDLKIEMIQ
ncbi:MAG: PTS sugar transporter subunit IIC [Christensenella sp.]|uniref:PTS transporter subunit IIC n=1 Tax=Christensenella sp. TaxID=1935934 RepID=UPI002B202DF6|nr:PTS sugar transporter subunit IIC [Christensenella sp.]MEA5003164.1 PTS sugar transporter subunit IIC [Christensenella sp.]